jgi:hypothetical protein
MLKRTIHLLVISLLFYCAISCSKDIILTTSEKQYLQKNDSLTVALFHHYCSNSVKCTLKNVIALQGLDFVAKTNGIKTIQPTSN